MNRAKPADILGCLQALAEAAPHTPSKITDRWRAAHRPLVERLSDLLATIPIETQTEGLSLRELQVRLSGRQRGRTAHAAELGAALRALGFTRVRRWQGADEGFRSLWKRNQRGQQR